MTDFGESSDCITFDSNEDTNLCTTYPNQLSLDPRICIIKPPLAFNTQPSNSETWVNFSPGLDYLKEFAVAETEGDISVVYGKIMNIYLNYDFISRQLEKASTAGDKKSSLSIFPSFEIMGINPTGEASFVTDFKFDTKITPQLATMISIGATAANKSTKDYDATAFSSCLEIKS